jgi:GxxExxY protein
MAEQEIVEKELSYLIMKAAYEVLNQLGPGFPEHIYVVAMFRELPACGVSVERQKRVTVSYKGKPLAEFILDLLAAERIILELKAVSELTKLHEQQALSYLKATGLPLAIVINFGAERLQYSRVVNTKGKATLPPRLPRIGESQK